MNTRLATLAFMTALLASFVAAAPSPAAAHRNSPFLGAWSGTGKCTGLSAIFGETTFTSREPDQRETQTASITYEYVRPGTWSFTATDHGESHTITATFRGRTFTFTGPRGTCTMTRA